MINNKYLEEFKIDLVKQYMQGKKKKEICKEYGIAKSTMWGWICKYASLIDNSWKVEDIKNVEEYIEKYCAYGCRYFILKKVENK